MACAAGMSLTRSPAGVRLGGNLIEGLRLGASGAAAGAAGRAGLGAGCCCGGGGGGVAAAAGGEGGAGAACCAAGWGAAEGATGRYQQKEQRQAQQPKHSQIVSVCIFLPL